ncbi:hypothetical protein JL721_10037 [Aureococcus anophagefferens]|nr:hypothetical protein JL721_10037 [Aureococcus anophagefferens]
MVQTGSGAAALDFAPALRFALISAVVTPETVFFTIVGKFRLRTPASLALDFFVGGPFLNCAFIAALHGLQGQDLAFILGVLRSRAFWVDMVLGLKRSRRPRRSRRRSRSRKADGDKPSAEAAARERLRRGKWTVEEEAYANRLIHEFKLGLLPLTDGTTLRTFLSKLLNCDPMRISKKFVGSNCIGKQVFRRRQADMDRSRPTTSSGAATSSRTGAPFTGRAEPPVRKSGGAGAKGVKGGDGMGGGLMQAQQRPMLAACSCRPRRWR